MENKINFIYSDDSKLKQSICSNVTHALFCDISMEEDMMNDYFYNKLKIVLRENFNIFLSIHSDISTHFKTQPYSSYYDASALAKYHCKDEYFVILVHN